MVYLFNVIELFGVNKMGAAGPRLGALRPKAKIGASGVKTGSMVPPSPRSKLFWKIIHFQGNLGGSSHSDPIEPPLKKYLFTSMTHGGYFEALSKA